MSKFKVGDTVRLKRLPVYKAGWTSSNEFARIIFISAGIGTIKETNGNETGDSVITFKYQKTDIPGSHWWWYNDEIELYVPPVKKSKKAVSIGMDIEVGGVVKSSDGQPASMVQ